MTSPNILVPAYVAATILPLLISSRRGIVIFGEIVLAGFAVSNIAYYDSFISVWCFFAAASSSVLLLDFLGRRRQFSVSALGRSPLSASTEP